MLKGKGQEKPTVFILYVPGGGMLGIIPAMVLARLEELTQTPTRELFPVREGVSTGCIVVAGLSQEGVSAEEGVEWFVQQGPRFFPYKPARLQKMSLRNGLNLGKYFFKLDATKTDFLKIREIHQLCDKYKEEIIHDQDARSILRELREMATQTWMKRGDQRKILVLCEQLASLDPKNKKYGDAIAELVATRTYYSRLGAVFRRNAAGMMDGIKDYFADKESYLHDPKVPEDYYKELFGDRKVSELPQSLYMSAYDVIRNRVVTFSKLNNNLFNDATAENATVQNDIKMWDAVMACTANPFAFPPHLTETNILASDKAVIHRPMSVKDVKAKVPKNTRVVFVTLGTGKYLSDDLIEFIERDLTGENKLSEQEQYRKKLEAMRDYYTEFGVFGNLVLGREMSELEGYISSAAREEFEEMLGKDNIIDITPRLTPHTTYEEASFPSRDVLDASEDNIKKIIRRARNLIRERDDDIRGLAQMLVDNLYIMNKMDDAKYAQVCKNIGLKSHKSQAELDKKAQKLESNIPSNDTSTGLRRVWRQAVKKMKIWQSDDENTVTRYDPPNHNPKP